MNDLRYHSRRVCSLFELKAGLMSPFLSRIPFLHNSYVQRLHSQHSDLKGFIGRLKMNFFSKPGRPDGSKYANAIQQSRLRGNTQRSTADALGISLSTVKRYWGRCIVE